jgi:hypothetical protein
MTGPGLGPPPRKKKVPLISKLKLLHLEIPNCRMVVTSIPFSKFVNDNYDTETDDENEDVDRYEDDNEYHNDNDFQDHFEDDFFDINDNNNCLPFIQKANGDVSEGRH